MSNDRWFSVHIKVWDYKGTKSRLCLGSTFTPEAHQQKASFAWGHCLIPHLPVPEDLCLGVLPFLQRKILPVDPCTGEWGWLLTNQHRLPLLPFVFCFDPYPTFTPPSPCFVCLNFEPLRVFFYHHLISGSLWGSGFVEPEVVPEFQLTCRFSVSLLWTPGWNAKSWAGWMDLVIFVLFSKQ